MGCALLLDSFEGVSVTGIMASFAYLVQVALLLVATIHASPLPRSSATTLLKRATIASSKIVGLTETIPDGHFGDLYKAYQPYLKVRNGCVPFPAVDIDGNTKYVSFPFPFIRSCY